jgi:hypothetical protein
MLKVWLAKNLEEAKEVASSDKNWVAIETEYGGERLDDSHPNVALSLNHHGELQDEKAPAEAYHLKLKRKYDNFIISHIDIDTLFGILWTAGWLKKTNVTLSLAALISIADKHGFHIAEKHFKDYDRRIISRYLAIGYLVNSWVINDDGLLKKDVSKEVHKLLLKIKDIILDGATKEQIANYKLWFEKQNKSAKSYLINIVNLCNDNLLVYRAPFRLTTAYNLGDVNGALILQYNEQSKTITLSCIDDITAEKYFGKDGVIEPLQIFFGDQAGGKKAIGGSPRDINLQPEMLNAFLEFLKREYFNIPEIIQLVERNKDVPNYST